jgi:hypothetical protein
VSVKTPVRRRAGLTLAVIVALAGSGCLGWEGGESHSGRHVAIAGTLWMSGGPAPGRRRLRITGIRVLAGTRVVARTTTDRRGRFQLVLAPGRYRLTLTDGSGLLPKYVEVAANRTARIRLTLSVK